MDCKCFSHYLCDEHYTILTGMADLPELLKEAQRDWSRRDREDLVDTLGRLVERANEIIAASDLLGY